MKLSDLVEHLRKKPNQDAEVEYVIFEEGGGNIVCVDLRGASTIELMRIISKPKPGARAKI